MTGDFELARQSARRSLGWKTARRAATALIAAWSTAVIGRRWAAGGHAWHTATRGARIRWWAIAVATAAAAHLLLRSFLSPTVAPAMPAAFYLAVAAAGAWLAWMADAVDRAWHGSRLSQMGPGSWVLGLGQDPSPKSQVPTLKTQDPRPKTQDPS